jgi:FixJ family two-component response regulator
VEVPRGSGSSDSLAFAWRRRTRRTRTLDPPTYHCEALAQRARLILACAEGKTNTVVAQELGVTKQMVGKWRARFCERRVDGLLDEPPPRCSTHHH